MLPKCDILYTRTILIKADKTLIDFLLFQIYKTQQNAAYRVYYIIYIISNL